MYLKRAHAKFFGQGEGLLAARLCLFDHRGVALNSDLAVEEIGSKGWKSVTISPGIVLSRMDTVFAPSFAVARYCWPSPLKSPTVMNQGNTPPLVGSGEEGAITLSIWSWFARVDFGVLRTTLW